MDLARTADLPDDLRAVLRFGDTVSEAHFRLSGIVGDLHGERSLANASRGVLRFLIASGPKTVPEIAAWRATSRQFIQRIVDALEAEGLVALQRNPQHRRSRLVEVTEAGRGLIGAMIAREAALLEAGLARSGARLAEIEAATALIRRFIDVIDCMSTELQGGTQT
jgi:DNA-binding MarR family transcriptional regulator